MTDVSQDSTPGRDEVGSVLVLGPSGGMGGGIERYLETVEDAVSRAGLASARFNLRPGDEGRLGQHRRVLRAAHDWVLRQPGPTRVVAGHRALLPVAVAVDRRCDRVTGTSVVLHGTDVWGSRLRPEAVLLRSSRVRPVAVSSFTAGVLGPANRATRLTPAFSADWYRMLLSARPSPQRPPSVVVMTSFRLVDWRSKGLPTLVAAVEMLDVPAEVRVCGSGTPPSDLLGFLSDHPTVRLLDNLTDRELAEQYAEADVFALATRLRDGRGASGEGFGMVLAEAQLAGTMVVAPAFGGSFDAFVERVTGCSPVDESAESLARVLAEVLVDEPLRTRIAAEGRRSAELRFEPSVTAAVVLDRLL